MSQVYDFGIHWRLGDQIWHLTRPLPQVAKQTNNRVDALSMFYRDMTPSTGSLSSGAYGRTVPYICRAGMAEIAGVDIAGVDNDGACLTGPLLQCPPPFFIYSVNVHPCIFSLITPTLCHESTTVTTTAFTRRKATY